jgi:hypothetical protein
MARVTAVGCTNNDILPNMIPKPKRRPLSDKHTEYPRFIDAAENGLLPVPVKRVLLPCEPRFDLSIRKYLTSESWSFS